MKHHFKSFIILSLTVLLLSCDKESNTTVVTNGTLTIDDKSYILDKALVMNWGEYNGMDEYFEGYRMIIGLYSPDVSIQIANNEVEALLGTGHGAEFELLTESTDNITFKEFTLSSSYTVNTFTFAVIYQDFSFDTDEMQDGKYIADGKLSLELKNDVLTFSSTLKLVSGEEVTINYSGSYTFIEP